jgi:hypothetical protein
MALAAITTIDIDDIILRHSSILASLLKTFVSAGEKAVEWLKAKKRWSMKSVTEKKNSMSPVFFVAL